MKSTNWKDIAELTGIAAIVASLIFVGMQLQQDRDISHREAHSEFVDTRIELARLLAENREIWIEGLKGSPLNEQEQWTFHNLVTVFYFDRYNRYVRRQMGLEIDDDAIALARIMALRMYQYPGYRKEMLAVFKRLQTISEALDGDGDAFVKAVIEALAEFDRNSPVLSPPDYVFL